MALRAFLSWRPPGHGLDIPKELSAQPAGRGPKAGVLAESYNPHDLDRQETHGVMSQYFVRTTLARTAGRRFQAAATRA